MNVKYILDTISSSWISSNALLQKGQSGGSYTFGLLRKCTVSHWTMVKPNWQGPLYLTIKTVSGIMYEKDPGNRHPK